MDITITVERLSMTLRAWGVDPVTERCVISALLEPAEAMEPIPTPEVRDSGFVEFEEAGGVHP